MCRRSGRGTGNFAEYCFSAVAQVTFQANVFLEGVAGVGSLRKMPLQIDKNNKDTLVTVETK